MHKQSPLTVIGIHTAPYMNQCIHRLVCGLAGPQPNELQAIPEEEDECAHTQGTDNVQAQTQAGSVGCKAGPACSQFI